MLTPSVALPSLEGRSVSIPLAVTLGHYMNGLCRGQCRCSISVPRDEILTTAERGLRRTIRRNGLELSPEEKLFKCELVLELLGFA